MSRIVFIWSAWSPLAMWLGIKDNWVTLNLSSLSRHRLTILLFASHTQYIIHSFFPQTFLSFTFCYKSTPTNLSLFRHRLMILLVDSHTSIFVLQLFCHQHWFCYISDPLHLVSFQTSWSFFFLPVKHITNCSFQTFLLPALVITKLNIKWHDAVWCDCVSTLYQPCTTSCSTIYLHQYVETWWYEEMLC